MDDIIKTVGERPLLAGVIIWYMPGAGYLACLTDMALAKKPATTIWDYQPTAERAIERLYAEHINTGEPTDD
jgi:hypothetical protein